MTIKQLIKEFTDAVKEKGYTLFYDNEHGVAFNTSDLLPDVKVSDTKIPTGTFKQVDTENGTTESEMLKTAIKLDLAQAIKKFTEMVRNGEFDKNGTYRIIFLNESRDGVPLKLTCNRFYDGELGLSVHKVHPHPIWFDAGDAWFSSNEQSDTDSKTPEQYALENITKCMLMRHYSLMCDNHTPENIDTITLEKAIQICKDNGLKVIKTITQDIEM